MSSLLGLVILGSRAIIAIGTLVIFLGLLGALFGYGWELARIGLYVWLVGLPGTFLGGVLTR